MIPQAYEIEFLDWLFSQPAHRQTAIIKMVKTFYNLGVGPRDTCRIIRETLDKA